MNKTIVGLIAAAALALAPGPTVAGGAGHAGHKSASKPAAKKSPPPAKRVVAAVCPVMGTKIPDVSKAAGKSVYKGKTYYFCCGGCKPKFDKDPENYVKKQAEKKVVAAVCPVMGTKIPDVSKAAGKSVYKGKTYYFCCGGCKPKFDKDPENYLKKQAGGTSCCS